MSRRRKNENVCEMSKMKTARAKHAKLLFFTIKYANLFLLPSSSWLRKFPIDLRRWRRCWCRWFFKFLSIYQHCKNGIKMQTIFLLTWSKLWHQRMLHREKTLSRLQLNTMGTQVVFLAFFGKSVFFTIDKFFFDRVTRVTQRTLV